MNFQIRKYRTFPTSRKYWPNAKWYDAELNEVSEVEAERMFKAGEELYVESGFKNSEPERVVWSPMSGEEPAVSLDAIDFQALAMQRRLRDLQKQGREFNRQLREARLSR